uniref:Uncharacterized protein n=1 Tax=viral metagenome TaxID=1070528 RepID=A0A6C0C690_9ZZZZ
MDILKELIFNQNKELLKNVSDNFYPNMKEEQIEFIKNYNKKNFTYLRPVKRDLNNVYEKRLNKIMK